MITILVGLPGSGKTWYANNMLQWDVFIDDPKTILDLPKTLHYTQHMVIADPMLCISKFREIPYLQAMYTEHKINYIFFENSPQKCIKNVEYRANLGDKRKVINVIHNLTKVYDIPHNSKIIKIWSDT